MWTLSVKIHHLKFIICELQVTLEKAKQLNQLNLINRMSFFYSLLLHPYGPCWGRICSPQDCLPAGALQACGWLQFWKKIIWDLHWDLHCKYIFQTSLESVVFPCPHTPAWFVCLVCHLGGKNLKKGNCSFCTRARRNIYFSLLLETVLDNIAHWLQGCLSWCSKKSTRIWYWSSFTVVNARPKHICNNVNKLVLFYILCLALYLSFTKSSNNIQKVTGHFF